MSFYGNISNANRTNLTFDKVYPNRDLMDRMVLTDNVLIGRFVLVEYDNNTEGRRVYSLSEESVKRIYEYRTELENTRFESDKDQISIPQFTVYNDWHGGVIVTPEYATEYGLKVNDIIKAYKEFTGNGNEGIPPYRDEIFYLKCVEISDKVWFEYLDLSRKDVDGIYTDYYLNYDIDRAKYPDTFIDGWDSTIWQKTVENGIPKYEMIATLNSEFPDVKIVGNAPSIKPIKPFTDTRGNNKEYYVHVSTPWGFKVKEVDKDGYSDEYIEHEIVQFDEYDEVETLEKLEYPADIYYNKKGFDVRKHVKSDMENKFAVLPTGISGKKYFNHTLKTVETFEEDGETYTTTEYTVPYDKYVEKPDTQEMIIRLPAIGNAVCDLYDLMYGDKIGDNEYNEDRNTSLYWGNQDGLRMVKPDPQTGGFTYEPVRVETVAGAINTMNDLMGAIIYEENELNKADLTHIYYRTKDDEGNEIPAGYYIKVPKIEIVELDEDLEGYKNGKRGYPDLEQFLPNRYFTSLLAYKYKGEDGEEKRKYNYFLESNISPKEATAYYDLMAEPYAPVKVKINDWKPAEKDEKGEYINYYFYKDNKNYIQDLAETPEHDDYYNITSVPYTTPDKTGEDRKIFYNPKAYKLNKYEAHPDDNEDNPIPFNSVGELEDKMSDIISDEDLNLSKTSFYVLNSDNETYTEYIIEVIANELNTTHNLRPTINNTITLEDLYEFEHIYNQSLFLDEGVKYYTGYFRENDRAIERIYDKEITPYDENEEYFKIQSYFVEKVNTDGKEVDAFFIKNEFNEEVPIKYEKNITDINDPICVKDNGTYEVYFVDFKEDEDYYERIINEEDKSIIYNYIEKIEDTNASTTYYTLMVSSITGVLPDEDSNNGTTINTQFYKTNTYYYKNKGNYLLDRSLFYRDGIEYYLIDNPPPVLESKFYLPDKYYIELEDGTEIKDSSRIMRTPDNLKGEFEDGLNAVIQEAPSADSKSFIYYDKQNLYIMSDELGHLDKGQIWNGSTSNLPSTIKLGKLKLPQDYEWKELNGYAQNSNTINGLILDLNNFFSFNNKLIRDEETIQGNINTIQDLINHFPALDPGAFLAVDSYGRVNSAVIDTDDWISVDVSPDEYDEEYDRYYPNPSIIFRHSNAGNAVGDSIGEAKNGTLKFGESFTSLSIGIDEKGHIANSTESGILTLPTLTITDNLNEIDKVITGLSVDQEGNFAVSKTAVNNLKLDDSFTISSKFADLDSQLAILNGDENTEGSVKYQLASLIAGAPEKFDTFKEVADWIGTDTTGAAQMQINISDLQADNLIIKADVDSIEGSIETLNNKDTELENTITTLQETIENLQNVIEELQGRLDSLENPNEPEPTE